MAEQRGGEVRDEKDLEFGGGAKTLGELLADLKDIMSGGEPIVRCANVYVDKPPRPRLQHKENVENVEFGRDTNRLDYFSVAPFDVHGDKGLRRIPSYGGGGDRTRQVPVGNFATNIVTNGGGGGRRGGGEVGLQPITASADAGASFELKDSVFQEVSMIRSRTPFPSTNSIPSIQDCMTIVSKFPGFEPGSDIYNKALRIFWKKKARESFMIPPTDETKLQFLKSLMEQ